MKINKSIYIYIFLGLLSCFVTDVIVYLYVNLGLMIKLCAILCLNLLYISCFFVAYFSKDQLMKYITSIILFANILIVPFIIIVNDYSFHNSTNYGWKKYSKFPVLGNIKYGSFFDPCVIRIDDEYWMYFSYRKNGDIELSKSKDGMNWSVPISVLRPEGADTWESIINRACVVYMDDKFLMRYTGQSGGRSSIGFAESDDGIHFTKYSNNPIVVPELDFEGESVMNPNVIYHKNKNKYLMYYAAGEQFEPDCIGYAESEDGIHRIKRETPVLEKNNTVRSYDYFKVGATDVHIIDDDTYIMFYIGYTDIHTGRIMFAVSSDGIHRKKMNKYLIQSSMFGFDGDSVYKPSVLFNEKENKYMMWYNGRLIDREYIGYAECAACELIK